MRRRRRTVGGHNRQHKRRHIGCDNQRCPAIEGSVDASDLLVPRDYLQGEWCDGDGQTWAIGGDTARFEDSTGAVGELPVDIVFLDAVGSVLISQTDSEFTIVSGGDEISFTRGSC